MKRYSSTHEIRKTFLDYFKKEGHTVVPSSSLVPENDLTLLFTNAGMVQFKSVFLGKETRPYKRATSAQRCVRAGGKHNDLEKVGYTARHHTFFEMLGNFSFGDYFKREAIQFSWNFLTKVLELPQEKLWISVYKDDTESEKIWRKEIKVDPTRFSHGQDKDNFWAMAETGPCGPCTEIFYDHGPLLAGGPPGSPDQDGDRYTELWNLVFMQYNRLLNGTLEPLPKPSVDTGMGLERLAAVLQGVHSNYETDVFQSLIASIAALAPLHAPTESSFKVIADHIRSASFLVMDGAIPSNEGRGYVLRRIIRRALRHGAKLGISELFFYRLVKPLSQMMGDHFPELIHRETHIAKCLQQEEQLFSKTLVQGLAILEAELPHLRNSTIPGQLLFRLYDTYGFPVDLVADIAKEKNLTLDTQGFETEMAKQRDRARATRTFQAKETIRYRDYLPANFCTVFSGYETLAETCRIMAIFHKNEATQELKEGESGILILDRSPFYPEGGGQAGDHGTLNSSTGQFTVKNTEKEGPMILHHGTVKRGVFRGGDTCEAAVDEAKRQKAALNHSATHLLHAALRRVLGDTALQKGSLVHPDHLRFDFAYGRSLTEEEMRSIEAFVNQTIRANLTVETLRLSPAEAIKKGAIGLFENKYAEEVRVLKMGDVSMELCGGTHVKRTGDIGFFKITSEESIAKGVRRIEALTGEAALSWVHRMEHTLKSTAELLKGEPHGIPEKTKQLLDQHKKLEKNIDKLQTEIIRSSKAALLQKVKEQAGVKILVAEVAGLDAPHLRNLSNELKNALGNAIILIASIHNDAIILMANVSEGCQSRAPANQLVQFASEQIGGKGGGRANMAEGGGNELSKLPQALVKVETWILEKVR